MKEEIQVLCVDDDPEWVSFVAERLRTENERIDVRIATDGDEGVQHVWRDPVDCIVSDYRMPKLDGVEFLRAVRETHPKLPFVIFTAHGEPSVITEAFDHGATDFVEKGSGGGAFSVLSHRIERAVAAYRRRQRLERTDSAVSAAREGVAFIDDGTLREVNDAYTSLFGYAPGDLEDSDWRTLFDDESISHIEEDIASVPDQGRLEGRAEGMREDGTLIDVNYALARAADGSVVQLVLPARPRVSVPVE